MLTFLRSSLVLLAATLTWAQQDAGDKRSPFILVPPAISDDLKFGAPFPEFDAKDIKGRRWRSSDLQGKFTLIYIWNTFDARSVDALRRGRVRERLSAVPDLPELQRFYDQVKNSRNIQVLTFTTDFDYMHAHEYMKENSYNFPVIADWVLIGSLFPRDSCMQGCGGVRIPSPSPDAGNLAGPQWVVDPHGRLSFPFRSWSLGRLLFEIEKAAQGS